ncbi:AAA+-type ATPase, variant 3 [Entomophthora muscae]|uniref:AAA+-type ATPase, variant 3 n=1 Tax=Entomophthora muscae TaxID=34485 RepID=A0ACC2RYI4_9FUNG|nr:AAA+-type ATPase, variant 3 [Entomophthora muscae]
MVLSVKANRMLGLQASAHLLRNCGAAQGSQVQIARMDVSCPKGFCLVSLSRLGLEPLSTLSLSGSELAELIPYVSQLLGSLEFVCLNNTLDISVAGKPVRFRVTSLEGTHEEASIKLSHHSGMYGVGRFIPGTTKVMLEHRPEAPVHDANAGYVNIGGLKSQTAELQSVLKLVMGEDIFSEYGLTPPRGVLLYGPPGTGKTLVAKAAAHTAGATPFLVSAPELVSRYVGETEQKIKNLFTRAQEAQPSVICFDEIDSLCPQRDKSQSELEKRTVATLLTLMDGISQKNCKLLVIGTTNRPNAIDPALRRPGRFDLEIEIGIPGVDDRLDILAKLLAATPNTLSQADLEAVSGKAHGYVGADLAALVKEAGLLAIRRSIKSDENVCICNQDIEAAFNHIQPSAMREVAVQVPKVYWSEIGGHGHIRQKLQEAVEWPLKRPEVFQRLGIRPPRGVLLYGPPGCSKTLMAKALATEAGVNFLLVKGPELFNQYVGESEKAVQEIFRKARAASPAIIFLDEIDALTVRRGNTSSVAERVLAQFLTEMDGINALNNVTVVGATNRPDIIDPALLRPGRIDRILYVGAPDNTTRKEILAIQRQKMPFAPDVDLDWLVGETQGCSGAEMVGLCQDAALAALERDIHSDQILRKDFQMCLDRGLTRGITQEMLDFFHDFQTKSNLVSV